MRPITLSDDCHGLPCSTDKRLGGTVGDFVGLRALLVSIRFRVPMDRIRPEHMVRHQELLQEGLQKGFFFLLNSTEGDQMAIGLATVAMRSALVGFLAKDPILTGGSACYRFEELLPIESLNQHETNLDRFECQSYP